MSRKRKRPKYDPARGRHKKRASMETRDWDANLPAPRPPWMDRDTYKRLAEFRRRIDPWA